MLFRSGRGAEGRARENKKMVVGQDKKIKANIEQRDAGAICSHMDCQFATNIQVMTPYASGGSCQASAIRCAKTFPSIQLSWSGT